MNTIVKTSLIAMFVGLGAAAVAAQPYAPLTGVKVTSDNVLLVNDKKKHKRWVYTEKYGPRYRHRRHGYTYFYEGYYYPRPYWQPGVSIHLGM